MSQGQSVYIRRYRAPLPLTAEWGPTGTWYGEYDGIFTVREFIIRPDGSAAVAPFDAPFREAGHPTEPPIVQGVTPISLQEFEALWERFAQPQLHELAADHLTAAGDADIRYFRSPFPAEFKVNEAASDIYTEYAAGVARRSFEVFADHHTLVAPYDMGAGEISGDEMLRLAREGQLTADGEPIEPPLRPEEISRAAFEMLWERHAIPRLHDLAKSAAGGQNRA